MKKKSLDNVTVVIVAFTALKKALHEDNNESPVFKQRNFHKKGTQGIDEINLCKILIFIKLYLGSLKLNLPLCDYYLILIFFLLMN